MMYTKEELKMIEKNISDVEQYLINTYADFIGEYDNMYCVFNDQYAPGEEIQEYCLRISGADRSVSLAKKGAIGWYELSDDQRLPMGIKILRNWLIIKDKLACAYDRSCEERRKITTGFVL